MAELSESVRELLRRDPLVAGAVAEVDRSLIRAALRLSPMERLRAATVHLRTLRRFKRVAPSGS